eukprot:gene10341-2477_t
MSSVNTHQHVVAGHGECFPTVEILALGPLTNVAIAARLDTEFPATVKHLFIMSGTHRARGNVDFNPVSEFNAHADPESLDICLRTFIRPVLVTWEACLDHSLPWEKTSLWRNDDSSKGRFLKKITRFTQGLCESHGWPFTPADPLAAAVCLYPEIVTEGGAELQHVEVELAGSKTRAQSVVDKDNMNKCIPNTWIISNVNGERLLHIFKGMTDE